jgi:hypothetical protein
VEVGVGFVPLDRGTVTAIQFYRGAPSASGFTVHLWEQVGDGKLLATGHGPGNQAPGWQTVSLDHAVPLQPFATYEASYYSSTGGYAVDQNYFTTSGPSRGPLLAFGGGGGEAGPSVGNGFFHYGAGGGFPNQTYLSSNYWVSPVFQPDAGAAPAVTALSQTSGPTAGGTTLTISGANFTPDAIAPAVYFGDVRAQLSMFSVGQIVIIIPPHPAGNVDVRVLTDAGESVLTPDDLFTYTL